LHLYRARVLVNLRRAAAAMAVLSAFAASLGGFFAVVGKVSAGRLAAFTPGLGCAFMIIGEVARVFITGRHDASPLFNQGWLYECPSQQRALTPITALTGMFEEFLKMAMSGSCSK
jgi:hypothetical protein